MLGADPEFAVWDLKDERFLPAHRVGVPKRGEMKNLRYFRDGYGVEINPEPFTCIGLGIEGFRKILRGVEAAISEKMGEPGRYILKAPIAINVDPEESLHDAPPDVRMVGCNPAFNIYQEWLSPQVSEWTPQTHGLRMFAGHLHFSGWPKMHNPNLTVRRIKLLDILVGVPLTYIFQDEPLIFARRQFYGRAGEFRLQNYGEGVLSFRREDGLARRGSILGLEYRTPGAELWRHQAITALFIAIARGVFTAPLVAENLVKQFLGDVSDEALQAAINHGEGLEKLLLPFYYHGFHSTMGKFMPPPPTQQASRYPDRQDEGSGDPVSGGVVSLEAIKKLREIREKEFGPGIDPFRQEITLTLQKFEPSKGYKWVCEPTEEAHNSWPEFPLGPWREHFEGLTL